MLALYRIARGSKRNSYTQIIDDIGLSDVVMDGLDDCCIRIKQKTLYLHDTVGLKEEGLFYGGMDKIGKIKFPMHTPEYDEYVVNVYNALISRLVSVEDGCSKIYDIETMKDLDEKDFLCS